MQTGAAVYRCGIAKQALDADDLSFIGGIKLCEHFHGDLIAHVNIVGRVMRYPAIIIPNIDVVGLVPGSTHISAGFGNHFSNGAADSRLIGVAEQNGVAAGFREECADLIDLGVAGAFIQHDFIFVFLTDGIKILTEQLATVVDGDHVRVGEHANRAADVQCGIQLFLKIVLTVHVVVLGAADKHAGYQGEDKQKRY